MTDGWYSAKCMFQHHAFGNAGEPGKLAVYEERIVLFRASSADEAIRLAESEASIYARDNHADYLGYVDVYQMFSAPFGSGTELYSLMRSSDLAPADFVTRYFDDGSQRSRR